MLEFGFTEEESQSAGRFSLCRVSCLDNHFIKQTRLPDPLSDLSSKLNLSDRYYLKDLTETAPLGEYFFKTQKLEFCDRHWFGYSKMRSRGLPYSSLIFLVDFL